jgi:hypothetical protein
VSKYSGAWHPGLGVGDDEPSSSAPSRAGDGANSQGHQNNYDYGRCYEERERAQAHAAQHAPRFRWEQYGDWNVLAVEFPASEHYVFVAEHPREYGRIVAHCEGCHSDRCSACRWAQSLYVAEIRAAKRNRPPDDNHLPF